MKLGKSVQDQRDAEEDYLKDLLDQTARFCFVCVLKRKRDQFPFFFPSFSRINSFSEISLLFRKILLDFLKSMKMRNIRVSGFQFFLLFPSSFFSPLTHTKKRAQLQEMDEAEHVPPALPNPDEVPLKQRFAKSNPAELQLVSLFFDSKFVRKPDGFFFFLSQLSRWKNMGNAFQWQFNNWRSILKNKLLFPLSLTRMGLKTHLVRF